MSAAVPPKPLPPCVRCNVVPPVFDGCVFDGLETAPFVCSRCIFEALAGQSRAWKARTP